MFRLAEGGSRANPYIDSPDSSFDLWERPWLDYAAALVLLALLLSCAADQMRFGSRSRPPERVFLVGGGERSNHVRIKRQVLGRGGAESLVAGFEKREGEGDHREDEKNQGRILGERESKPFIGGFLG